jgi:drug/metabolite transporter (DMT)-like permease
MNWRAVFYALASAALFGVSTPAAKVLLGSIHPAVLAGLLYCGASIGVAVLRWLRLNSVSTSHVPDSPLTRSQLPWLAGAVAAGGVAGPVLLMLGLSLTEASTASLLLTLEGAATALLAWFIFRESFDRRIAFGVLCLVVGAIAVSWSGTPTLHTVLGPLAIIGACIAWGLDNNLTRKISYADPLQIVALKSLVAGPIGGRDPSRPVFRPHRGHRRLLLLRRKPRVIRYGITASRYCANGRIFLDGAIFWRSSRRGHG